MPIIKPTSAQDCINFLENHRSEIKSGTYNINIDKDLIKQLPENSLLFLAQYCSVSHSTLACSQHSPHAILEILAKDEDSSVRQAVASKPNTPTSVLEILMKDEHFSARQAVAGNPNTPTSVS